MIPTAAVAVGGALGSVARYWVGLWVIERFGGSFPVATLVINILGSFVIGLFAAATAVDGPLPTTEGWRIFVMVGLCGGFTTFSAFSLQTLVLVRSGATIAAFANVALSVGLCLGAVGLGWWIGDRA